MADSPKYVAPKAVRLRDAETARGDCTATGGFFASGDPCWSSGNQATGFCFSGNSPYYQTGCSSTGNSP